MIIPFFNQALKKSIYKCGYRFIGQHFGYRTFKYKELSVIGIGQNFHTGASLLHIIHKYLHEMRRSFTVCQQVAL